MRFGGRFSTSGFKVGFCAWILSLMLFPTAEAFSFFGLGKKKAPREALPPVLQQSPTINPNLVLPKKNAQQADQPVSIRPESLAPRPLAQPADPVKTLIEQKVYPADWQDRTTPLTRAELADVLVKALKHDLRLVSEFPFYRDVPKDYWAYNAIEVGRAKKLLVYKEDHGFYYPDKPVTFADVFTGIANAITGKPPLEDEISFYLIIYPDWEEVPEELWPAVAKMTRARFFEGQLSPALQLSVEPTPKALAPYIVALSHLNERRVLLPPQKEALLPAIPGGLTLTVSPAVAIFESRLAIGDSIYFSLAETVDQLPKGSKIRGTVKDSLGTHTYVIELVEAETPEEKLFRINGELTLVFRNKALPFIVPGESFQVTTRQLPGNAAPAQAPSLESKPSPTPAPPPGSPTASSRNTAAQSSVPHSVK
jgi:hypothetical protein